MPCFARRNKAECACGRIVRQDYIILEILENITAYLKKHVIQVELVIVTSLIAVSRKIIILDLEKKTAADLIGLSTAILALSISYLIVRYTNRNDA
jgi:uncharacterized membrane protein (DUF373 family)